MGKKKKTTASSAEPGAKKKTTRRKASHAEAEALVGGPVHRARGPHAYVRKEDTPSSDKPRVLLSEGHPDSYLNLKRRAERGETRIPLQAVEKLTVSAPGTLGGGGGHNTSNAVRRRKASLRVSVREALQQRVSEKTLDELRLLGMDFTDQPDTTFATVISAKIVTQALMSGRPGDKAVDQLIAMEPKELHIDVPDEKPSLASEMLSRLTPEQLAQLREIRKALQEAAPAALEADYSREDDDAS